MIFTRKSSLYPAGLQWLCFATKSILRERHKALKQLPALLSVQRFAFRLHGDVFFVRLRKFVQRTTEQQQKGKRNATNQAGIQNSFTWRWFMTYNPTDLAVPELITILTPSRLARISVTRRPSIKLKMTPHIHPSDNPFRNMAATLNGVESNPNKISEDSASNTEVEDKLKPFFRFQLGNQLNPYEFGNNISQYL